LQQADVVFLMGARFNWIMHFGLPPRVQQGRAGHPARHRAGSDAPEQARRGSRWSADGKAIVGQLNQALAGRQWFYPKETAWRAAITKKSAENAALIAPQIADESSPGGYYRLLRDVARVGAEERDRLQRGRQHDGHRPHPAAELQPAPAA